MPALLESLAGLGNDTNVGSLSFAVVPAPVRNDLIVCRHQANSAAFEGKRGGLDLLGS
jgi:hypothetical protein